MTGPRRIAQAPAPAGALRPGRAPRPAGSPSAERIARAAADLRRAAAAPLASGRIAAAMAAACARWRDPACPQRRRAIDSIAGSLGHSRALLDESLNALLAPFSTEALGALVSARLRAPALVGLVMPGNVVGAGLHELVQALVAGAAVMVKASSAEPVFFRDFARTVADLDAAVGERISVFDWSRHDHEQTRALVSLCDLLAVLGDDETVGTFEGAGAVGFGSRVSGALVAREAAAEARWVPLAQALARDVTLFEQRGCLSPHHVFVEESSRAARDFAGALAQALEAAARRMPPPQTLDVNAAAALRRERERARWRRLGGAAVELWEGAGLSWAVIFDPQAGFRISPQYRTVFVSAVEGPEDLEGRLKPVAGKLEAFAIADPADRLGAVGSSLREQAVSYLCPPGEMQSPPPHWRHGNGIFLERLREAAR